MATSDQCYSITITVTHDSKSLAYISRTSFGIWDTHGPFRIDVNKPKGCVTERVFAVTVDHAGHLLGLQGCGTQPFTLLTIVVIHTTETHFLERSTCISKCCRTCQNEEISPTQ